MDNLLPWTSHGTGMCLHSQACCLYLGTAQVFGKGPERDGDSRMTNKKGGGRIGSGGMADNVWLSRTEPVDADTCLGLRVEHSRAKNVHAFVRPYGPAGGTVIGSVFFGKQLHLFHEGRSSGMSYV